MTVLVLVQTVVLAILTVLVIGLLRAHGTVLRRLHQLDGGVDAPAGARTFALRPVPPSEPGTERAPSDASHDALPVARDISGETVTGEIVSARVVDVEHDTLLLFLSSGCSSCAVFWDELSRPVPLPADARLLVVPQGPEADSVGELTRLAPSGIDVVLSSDAWRDYEVPGSPHAVFVDGRTGRVRGEGTGQSLRQVAGLLAQSTGDAGFVTGAGAQRKPARDAAQEAQVDRALLAAGILPGDPRLYDDHQEKQYDERYEAQP